MGLHFLGVVPIALLHRQKRLEVAKPVGLWGAYVMGLAFAFGWTPCIGPILAAILAVAASEQTVAKGAGLLAVYSLGLGIPFLLAAFAIEPFAAFLARFRRHLAHVERVMGGLLVLTGIAFLTGFVTHGELLAAGGVPGAGPDRVEQASRRGAARVPASRAVAKTPGSAALTCASQTRVTRYGAAPGHVTNKSPPRSRGGRFVGKLDALRSPCRRDLVVVPSLLQR